MERIKELGETFDVKTFLVEQMHAGITSEETLTELLAEEFEKIYQVSTAEEIQQMAAAWVRETYDDAQFVALADDQEAEEEYCERESALADATAGRW